MKKKDSWDSEFRKRRFYYNKEKKALKIFGKEQLEVFPSVLTSSRVSVPKSLL
ncbi:MAG: hypothetical protein K2G03_04000 [Bacilli bacterium]|nr:hypothetical protein [Bacilli bacterium]